MGLFGHTKVDPKKKVNEMSGLLRNWYKKFFLLEQIMQL